MTDVRRRFCRAIKNFLVLYRTLADSWFLCDNSLRTPSVLEFSMPLLHGDLWGAVGCMPVKTFLGVFGVCLGPKSGLNGRYF
jgi:hypothetical protein